VFQYFPPPVVIVVSQQNISTPTIPRGASLTWFGSADMMVSNARPLGHLVGRLNVHLHLNRTQLYGKLHRPQKFSLNLIVPPSKEVETISFGDVTALDKFLTAYNGSLYTVDSAGKREFIPPKQYKTLSPFETYEIDSPYFMAIKSVQHYEQISDKAFEDKSRNAMITFMQNAGTAFKELDRVIKDGEKVVAEWEGVFDIDDGHGVYFLECKHRVTAVSTSLSHLC
jgi:hypothetical protein